MQQYKLAAASLSLLSALPRLRRGSTCPRATGGIRTVGTLPVTSLAQGVSVKELAEYLGHSDPGFTLRTYTHLVPSSFERARLAIDGVFGLTSADSPEAT